VVAEERKEAVAKAAAAKAAAAKEAAVDCLVVEAVDTPRQALAIPVDLADLARN
jgi:hypothetical protein